MKITTHESDAKRQIVPQDMSNLSDADQEICKAVYTAMCTMFSVTPGTLNTSGEYEWGSTLIMKGCGVSYAYNDTETTAQMTIADGLLLHNGKLYEFEGTNSTASIVTGKRWDLSVFGLTVVFYEEICAPSPVYGSTGVLDQNPHHKYVARVLPSAEVPKSVDSVLLHMMLKVPVVGTATRLGLVEYTAI